MEPNANHQKNNIYTTKNKVGRPKGDVAETVHWRPRSKEVREKFLEIGGARWLNRVIEGLMGK